MEKDGLVYLPSIIINPKSKMVDILDDRFGKAFLRKRGTDSKKVCGVAQTVYKRSLIVGL
jgi:hypothetical protein